MQTELGLQPGKQRPPLAFADLPATLTPMVKYFHLLFDPFLQLQNSTLQA
jgi:hypothetical protein